MSVIPKLEKIIEWVDFLAIEAVPGPTSFEPGLARERVLKMLASSGVPPVPELVELYSWANGCSYIEGTGLMFPPLEHALRHFDDWHPDYGRPKTWFPIVTMNGNVYVYLDVETLALYSHDAECDDTRHLAEHYDVYLDAIIEGLTTEGAGYDEDDYGIFFGAGVWLDLAQKYSVNHPWLWVFTAADNED